MESFTPPEIPEGYFLMAHLVADSSLIKMRGQDVKVALWLLASVNIVDKKWYDQWLKKEILIKRGETVTSVPKIAKALQETEKVIRTSLRRLSKGMTGNDGFLSIITNNIANRANAYTHIKVLKYDTYQNKLNYKGIRQADGGQTTVRPQADDSKTAGSNLIKYNTDKEDNTIKQGVSSSPSFTLAELYRRCISDAVSIAYIEKQVRFYLDRNITYQQIEKIFCDPASKGKKVWELLDKLKPKSKQDTQPIYRAKDDPAVKNFEKASGVNLGVVTKTVKL